MKFLSGAELAGYMKENQAHTVKALRSRKIFPKLVIIRNNDNPVILKYVHLKQRYGEDIGVEVEDWYREDVAEAVREANAREDIHGMIVQLPLIDPALTDEVVAQIAVGKDVDGLGTEARVAKGEATTFESATATAINWLLAGYDVDLARSKIALVGRGRLIGAPLARMWKNSGYDVTSFGRGDDLGRLKEFDVVVSATGVPHLITSAMLKPGAVIVDAGTASEGGVLVEIGRAHV